MAADTESPPQPSTNLYRRLFTNRAFLFLWSGQTVSTFGDAFFNITVIWVVYQQSGSVFQTALIQVVWHLADILFGPVAGTVADRSDRKRIMLWSTSLAAVVVGMVTGAVFLQGQISPLVIFIAIFVLNSTVAFLLPARFSIMPTVVGRDLLATASGMFTTAGQVASFLGTGLAGVVIAVAGSAWAIMVDAFSFVIAALAIWLAPLPRRTSTPPSQERRPSLLQEAITGWRAIADLPILKTLVWLGVFLNVVSFLGPMMPALVKQRLGGDATAFSTLEALAIIGGVAGGAFTGALERRLGAGRLVPMGWGLAGVCALGMAISTSLPITAALEAVHTFGVVVGAIALGVLTQTLAPEQYLGRVAGISRALVVIVIPPSALLGGLLADQWGVAPMFAVGGLWMLGVSGWAWLNRQVRTARL